MALDKDFKFGKILGEGATAVTYEVKDSKDRRYCLKQYKTSVQSKDTQKVKREIEMLTRLEHPHIPQIYGSFIKELNGRSLLHVVQEMVDGQDVSKYLEKKSLSIDKIQGVLADTLGILVYLHELSPPIIHRDIKPSNLMLRLDGRIVLIDFGQAIDDIHRTFGQTMVTGTLGYQAPEQIHGEAVSKSDVYSLGVVAVELLTKRKPRTMLEGQVFRWERHCRHLPLGLQEWLDGVLHQDVSRRYSAKEALGALNRINDVFVEVVTGKSNLVSAQGISKDFLDLLDGAALDEDERKRKKREGEYRIQVEKARQVEIKKQRETEWKRNEASLWSEMEESWRKLLSMLESGRISVEKGMDIFEKTFSERVRICKDTRQWGEVDSRIGMLLDFSRDRSLDRQGAYEKWVETSILKEGLSNLDALFSKRRKLRYKIRDIENEKCEKNSWKDLFKSWWKGLFRGNKSQKRLPQIELVEVELEKIKEQEFIAKEVIKRVLSLYVGFLKGDSLEKKGLEVSSLERKSLALHSLSQLVLLPKGTFQMGGTKTPHKVKITKDFYVGKYPVTQELWKSVMGSNPSKFDGLHRPVENVSWFDCVGFCNKLSDLYGLKPAYKINGKDVSCNWSANGFRLLSEAEWEYAARGGEAYKYAGSNNVDEVAWHRDNSGGETHPVGQKKSNGFGLYDMSGNVREWVWDWYGDYSGGSQSDPTGASTGSNRGNRGGSWGYDPHDMQASSRGYSSPTNRNYYVGFRLVLPL